MQPVSFASSTAGQSLLNCCCDGEQGKCEDESIAMINLLGKRC
jgi:hypothetical protein